MSGDYSEGGSANLELVGVVIAALIILVILCLLAYAT